MAKVIVPIFGVKTKPNYNLTQIFKTSLFLSTKLGTASRVFEEIYFIAICRDKILFKKLYMGFSMREIQKTFFHYPELIPLGVILHVESEFTFLRPENLSSNQEKAIYMTYDM